MKAVPVEENRRAWEVSTGVDGVWKASGRNCSLREAKKRLEETEAVNTVKVPSHFI